MTITTTNLFGCHRFNGFKVDVWGYDRTTDKYIYFVETPYSSKMREAKRHYKHPDKRNEWAFPFGDYIYIVDPYGKKHRIQADYRP